MHYLLELVASDIAWRLECLEKRITLNHEILMSAISDFAAKQKAFNDRQSAAIDGVVADVKALNDKITELQNSPGQVTPEDQALLDELQTQGEALASRMEALDSQTPPVVPPQP